MTQHAGFTGHGPKGATQSLQRAESKAPDDGNSEGQRDMYAIKVSSPLLRSISTKIHFFGGKLI